MAPTGGITIQDLTITGGRAVSGGGVWNEGTLVLAGSRLEENTADGGGLANLGGQVIIERSELIGNSTIHTGGGLYTDEGTITIHDSTFAENAADGGAAIANENSTVLITNSAIVDNIAVFTGTGGITSRGILRVTNTTIA